MARPKSRPKPPEARPITDELLAAIRDSCQTDYALAQAAGISRSALGRFRSRERDLSLAALDRLARPLGLRLVRSARKKPRDGA